MEAVLDVISWVLLLAGGLLVFIGGLGVLRMPDLYTRMHSASITDTGGTVLVLLGLLLQAGLGLAAFKILAILVFLLVTGPTASYALAHSALLSGLRPVGRDETGTHSITLTSPSEAEEKAK